VVAAGKTILQILAHALEGSYLGIGVICLLGHGIVKNRQQFCENSAYPTADQAIGPKYFVWPFQLLIIDPDVHADAQDM